MPVTASQLASTGDLVAVLSPNAQGFYPGYMLFTRPGHWKVVVLQDTRVLGSVVFDVLEPRPSGSG